MNYNRRQFKKGFLWGSTLSATIFYQYSFYTFATNRTAYSKPQLMTMPIILAAVTGSVFGLYEIAINPQKKYLPIVEYERKIIQNQENELKKKMEEN